MPVPRKTLTKRKRNTNKTNVSKAVKKYVTKAIQRQQVTHTLSHSNNQYLLTGNDVLDIGNHCDNSAVPYINGSDMGASFTKFQLGEETDITASMPENISWIRTQEESAWVVNGLKQEFNFSFNYDGSAIPATSYGYTHAQRIRVISFVHSNPDWLQTPNGAIPSPPNSYNYVGLFQINNPFNQASQGKTLVDISTPLNKNKDFKVISDIMLYCSGSEAKAGHCNRIKKNKNIQYQCVGYAGGATLQIFYPKLRFRKLNFINDETSNYNLRTLDMYITTLYMAENLVDKVAVANTALYCNQTTYLTIRSLPDREAIPR